jgi:hypothetical protein
MEFKEESDKKTARLMKEFLAASKEAGNVDNDGKIRLFPEICDTPDLILEQYPMTEQQILSVTGYDRNVLDDAIDFLHGVDKGKIASSMYLCVYAKYYGLNEL